MSTSPVTPASPADAKSALVALFEAFPADRGDGGAAVATYLIAIEGYSLHAIQKAVKRLIRGEFEWCSGRFLPTPAEVSRACRYCEDLIAPPNPLALPAPGDVIDDSPEAVARRQQHVENCRKHRYDWQQEAEGKAAPPDPINPVDAYDAWEAREKARAQADNAAGRYRLSDEALSGVRKRNAA